MEKNNITEATENVIIADADYVDSVAFNLIVNFERMIGRHIPQADMAQWVECVAIDGGVSAKANGNANSADADASDAGSKAVGGTHVILIHDKNKKEMNNFNPGVYDEADATEERTLLNGQAFMGDYGEFTFSTVASDETSETMTKADIVTDVLAAMVDEPKVKRVMVIPNLDPGADSIIDLLLPVLRHLDRECQEKRITLFGMQPLTGVPCRTEILGYSLMAALGIRADEIKG